jgi:hypothetical protein
MRLSSNKRRTEKKKKKNRKTIEMKVAEETLHHMNNQEAHRSTKDDRDVEVTLKVLTRRKKAHNGRSPK